MDKRLPLGSSPHMGWKGKDGKAIPCKWSPKQWWIYWYQTNRDFESKSFKHDPKKGYYIMATG